MKPKVADKVASLVLDRLEVLDAAQKVLEKTPETVFGMSRPGVLLLLAGVADFASQCARKGSTLAKELRQARNTLDLAGVMALASEVAQSPTAGRPAVATPQPKLNVNWFARYEEGGRRVPTA